MFSKVLLAGAFAALAAAQSTVLTFTRVPNPVTDGQAQAITYSTNDTITPVTIILRQGPSGNLQTISTLTTSATDGQFIWTPDSCLPDGTDYALEITQANQINYFGPFTIEGASGAASCSSSSKTASSTTFVSSTVSANGTASTTVPIAPGTIGTMSAGTGTALPRNTTMSMATLTASRSASSTAGSPSSNMAGATGAGASASSTASAAASSSTGGASNVQVGTMLSMLFGAAAVAFCL